MSATPRLWPDCIILPWLEVQTLIPLAQAGDKNALAKIVESYYPFLVQIVWPFQRATRSLAFEDLVGYGVVGLINAIHKFDPAHGCRLTSLAKEMIRNEIINSVANFDRTIRVPKYKLADPGYNEYPIPETSAVPSERLDTPDHREDSGDRLEAIERVRLAIEGLDDRDSQLLRWHYGIDCDPVPPTEIAARFDVPVRGGVWALRRAAERRLAGLMSESA